MVMTMMMMMMISGRGTPQIWQRTARIYKKRLRRKLSAQPYTALLEQHPRRGEGLEQHCERNVPPSATTTTRHTPTLIDLPTRCFGTNLAGWKSYFRRKSSSPRVNTCSWSLLPGCLFCAKLPAPRPDHSSLPPALPCVSTAYHEKRAKRRIKGAKKI